MSLLDIDVRAACVTLSRLLDPREHGSVFSLADDADKSPRGTKERTDADTAGVLALGQAVEAGMHIVESIAYDIHRIADALERQTTLMEQSLSESH